MSADFDFALGDIADQIRETTRRFAIDRIAPIAARIDAENSFPRALWPEMGALGLHGITVEEEYGGLGLGYLEHVVAMEEISRASASVGLSYGAHSNCASPNPPLGDRGAKASCVARADFGRACRQSRDVRGRIGVGRGLDATTRGTPRRRLAIVRHQVLDHQRAGAQVLVVYAKSDPSAGPKGITTFLVERGMPGFSVSKKLDKMGMRGSDTAELVFEDCDVPAENMIGAEGQGAAILMSGLDYERAVLAGGPLGIMQACLDCVLPYVRERRQFNAAIGSFQLMQAKVADMVVALNSARAYVYAVARACDRGRTTRADAAGGDPARQRECCARVAGGDPGARRRRLHQGMAGGTLPARRQALRHWRRHQ